MIKLIKQTFGRKILLLLTWAYVSVNVLIFFTFDHYLLYKIRKFPHPLYKADEIEKFIPYLSEIYVEFSILISVFTCLIMMIFIINLGKKRYDVIEEFNLIADKMLKMTFDEHKLRHSDPTSVLDGNVVNLRENLVEIYKKYGSYFNETQQITNQLNHDIQDQKRKLDSLKSFTHNISHEVKTPLTIILSNVEFMKTSKYYLDDENMFRYDLIIKECEYLIKFTKDLLLYSEIRSPNYILEKEVYDLGDQIDQSFRRFGLALSDKDIYCKYKPLPKCLIYADKSKMDQVITNYITNAIDHVEGDKRITYDLVVSKKCVTFMIYNTGKQIDPKNKDIIWRTLYSSKSSTLRQFGGTGLGLSIVREIIQRHQGAYGFNDKNEGVEFYFEIPIYE